MSVFCFIFSQPFAVVAEEMLDYDNSGDISLDESLGLKEALEVTCLFRFKAEL